MTLKLLPKFDLDYLVQGVSVLGLFIYQKANFRDYKTASAAYDIFEKVTWLIVKSSYFDLLVTS